jgi:hypothetical protein
MAFKGHIVTEETRKKIRFCIRCHKEFDFPDGMMGKNLNKKLEVLPLMQK